MPLLIPLAAFDKAYRNLALALRSLWLHQLRAFLSVLGIIIGTGSVIALMAFGEGSMQDALDDIKRLGATNIIVRSQKPPEDGSPQGRRSFVATYGLVGDDYKRFATIDSVVRMVPMRVFPQEVRRGVRAQSCRIVATTPGYADVNQLDLAVGRFLIAEDEHSNTAVLGAGAAAKLFPFDNPLDQEILVGRFFYRVVGVCKERMPTGGSGGSQAAEDFNNDVYISLGTALNRIGEKVFIRESGAFRGEKVEFSQITLTVDDINHVRSTGDVVRGLLMEWHPKEDWAVTVPLDRLEQAERTKANFKKLLALIASISLVVGGIGIMNIMLATVTERTREIGIRRALGAKRGDIVMQFLIEAVVQTTIGGLLGVGFGVGLVFLVPWVSQTFWQEGLPAKIQYESIVASLVVAVGVGVVFGLYPAFRAARLDPIEALRAT